jgi:hypothetical protein
MQENGMTYRRHTRAALGLTLYMLCCAVAKTLENVEKLEDLEAKAESVENQAKQFEKGASTLKSVMRCKSYKVSSPLSPFALATIN